jgi:hypothetical protein
MLQGVKSIRLSFLKCLKWFADEKPRRTRRIEEKKLVVYIWMLSSCFSSIILNFESTLSNLF